MDRKKLTLVTLGHLSCDINAGSLPAALPYIRQACNLDYQATGGLMFAFSCLSSVIQPFFGLLADRHTKPWYIPLGVAMAGCGLALTGFLASYWGIFLCIMFSGIGSALFHPEGARFANRISGAHKSTAMSIFSIGGNSGFILGPLAVTFFVGIFGLHGMAFYAVLSLCTAAVLLLAITAMRQPAPTTAAPNVASELKEVEQEVKNDWREFGKLIFIIVSRTVVFVGCNTFIPLYWVNYFGKSAAEGAMALVMFGSCGVFFNFLGGLISDKLGCVNVIRFSYTLMAPAVFLFSQMPTVTLAWMVLPLLSLVIYTPFSSQVVLGQTLLARNIGFASGITLGLSTSLGGVAQPCLGSLADAYGLNSVFICLACCAVVGGIFSYMLKRRQA